MKDLYGRWATRVSPGPVIALVVVLYLVLSPTPYSLVVGSYVGVFAISALGLTIVAGRARQISLGQAGFMAIGAYAVAFGTLDWGLPFIVSLLLGGLVALVCGLVLGYIALRLEGHFLAMASLAFGLIVYGVLIIDGPTGGMSGKFGIPPISLFGLTIVSPVSQFVLTWLIVAACYALCYAFVRGRIGRELQALRDDVIAAAHSGVNTVYRKVQAFALSAFLGAIAGGLIPPSQGVVDPTLFAAGTSFQVFLMIVIGGLGSLPGAIVGAALITFLIQYVPGTGDAAFTALGVVVVLILTLAPGGLAELSTRASRMLADRGWGRPSVVADAPPATGRSAQ